MHVLIEVDGGVGIASWTDECGVDKEEFIGEVSTRWLEQEAEKHFGNKLGEDVVIEVIDNQDELVTREFYRVRNDTHWLNHNFRELDKAKKEVEALANGTHIASKLIPRDDYYIVKVIQTEERINNATSKT